MIQLATATLADADALVDLLEDMDRFYGVTEFDPPDIRLAQLQAQLPSSPPAAHVTIARTESAIVGLASYSFLWPAAGISQSLFLKELYVRRTARGQGIGRGLMDQIFQIAGDTGCSRVEWMTERANPEAQVPSGSNVVQATCCVPFTAIIR